jgi:hypothetical protein
MAEMPCSECTALGSLYVFSASLTRCAECVRCSVRYDDNFSVDDFDRLTAEQRKLEAVRDVILERVS